MSSERKNLKLMKSSKNVLGEYLVQHFGVNSAIYKLKSVETACFFNVFVHSGWHGGVFESFDSLHKCPLPQPIVVAPSSF
jgi:hypothetical protein